MSNLRVLVLAAFVVTAAALIACPATNTPQPSPASPTGPPAYTPPGPGVDNGGPVTQAPLDAGAAAADGAACTVNADCASGICEGLGCEAGKGTCAPRDRACTKDLRQYCGCDGKTFGASGSCPGARYEFAGSCEERKPKADGASCLAGTDCASGVCEGQGCGTDTPGTCMPKARRCTRDSRAYCGCDGKTFRGSGTCPGARYSAKGECPP